MLINPKTRQSLDFDRVLADLLPSSPLGSKCKSEMRPYLLADAEKLAHEWDAVSKIRELIISQGLILSEIKAHLKQIKDIHRSIEYCGSGGILNQVELFELKSLLLIMQSLNSHQNKLGWSMDEKYRVRELPAVLHLLDPQDSGIRSFYIYDEYSEQLRAVRLARAAKEQKLELLKKKAIAVLEEETGLKLRAAGEITVNKNQQDMMRRLSSCGGLQQSGETFYNVTYKLRLDSEMMEYMKKIEELKGEEFLEETRVLEQISKTLSLYCEDILQNMEAIGEFDLLIAKGELAIQYNCIRPELTEDGRCTIINGINPVVDKELSKKGRKYMPVSAALSEGVTLITGANMGGKTVSLKMLGLLAAMAQYGLFVPADSMRFTPFDFITISCGDEQSTDMGLSTFGGEIKSIAEALKKTDRRGFVLLDELARGTNPKEGFAISYAVIEYLMKRPCISVITTHLEGLERSGVRCLQVRGLQHIDFGGIASFEDISQYMDYSLIEVKGEVSIPEDAIKISRIMGLPEEIAARAEKVMQQKSVHP